MRKCLSYQGTRSDHVHTLKYALLSLINRIHSVLVFGKPFIPDTHNLAGLKSMALL